MKDLTDIAGVGKLGYSLAPQTVATATTTNGASFDCNHCEGRIQAVAITGNCGDSSLVLTFKVQEAVEDPASAGSPLSSDWSDVTGGAFDSIGGASGADNTMRAKAIDRTKRFLRMVATTAGAGTLSAPIAGGFIARKKMAGGLGVKL